MSKSALKRRANPKATVAGLEDSPARAKKRDVARHYRVSTRTVDSWIQQKKIPFFRFSSRCIRFDLAAVDRALSRFNVKELEL
jgi:excisionase family DNA binding protein